MALISAGVPSRAAIQAAIEEAKNAALAALLAAVQEAGAGRRARGVANVATSVAPGATVSVSFPAGRFSVAPQVQVTKQTAGFAKAIPYAAAITTSGFTLGIYSGDGTNMSVATVPVAWEAVQG